MRSWKAAALYFITATEEEKFVRMRDLGLTLAGGGNKSFYQLGILHQWGAQLLERTAVMAVCSAGACVATLYLSGRETEAQVYWQERRKIVTRNFEWRRVFKGQSPSPHHEPILRETLLTAYAEDGLARIRSQPFPILVLTTAIPKGLPVTTALLLGLGLHKLKPTLNRALPHTRLGFKALVFDARDCRTPIELADLMLASSATPPFTSVGRYAGHRLLDGGLVDNAPAFLTEQVAEVKRHLILLTHPLQEGLLKSRPSRLFIAPTKALSISTWDYTQPHLFAATIAQGEQDAEIYAPLLASLLETEEFS